MERADHTQGHHPTPLGDEEGHDVKPQPGEYCALHEQAITDLRTGQNELRDAQRATDARIGTIDLTLVDMRRDIQDLTGAISRATRVLWWLAGVMAAPAIALAAVLVRAGLTAFIQSVHQGRLR